MKDLKDYIGESLLDGFDAIADRMDDNIFSMIDNSKDIKEFERNVDALFELCKPVDGNPWGVEAKYKKSFFIARVVSDNQRSCGFVIDKMHKTIAYPLQAIFSKPWSTKDNGASIEYVYYNNSKLCVDKWGKINNNYFNLYLLDGEICMMPKDIEKQYLEFIRTVPENHIHMASGFGKQVIYGDELVKKIS